MSQPIIAIAILVVVMVLFITEVIPLWITAIGGMLAMCLTGILSFNSAFTAGFASVACVMTIGTCVIGNTFFTTGCATVMAEKLKGLANKGEGFFRIIICFCSGLLSTVVNGTVVTALFIPVIDAVAENSNGRIKRKNITLPMAISSVYGSCVTSFSHSAVITASGLLAASSEVGRPLTPFEPLKIMSPILIAFFVFMVLFGNRYSTWAFQHTVENPVVGSGDGKKFPFRKSKAIIFVCTLVFMLVALVGFEMNQGGLFLLVMIIVILTGCIDAKYAIKNNNWELILLLAGSMAFGRGIEVSGAAQLIADTCIAFCERLSLSAYVMAIMIMIIITIMSNFMSNNSATVIIMPIALAIATGMNADPMGFAMAVIVGANLSVATPVCTPAVSLTYGLGYHFMDYVKYGGLVNVGGVIIGSVLLQLFYF